MADTSYKFFARYDDSPGTSLGISLIIVDASTVYTPADYSFYASYESHNRVSKTRYFDLRYSDDNTVSTHVFTFISKVFLGELVLSSYIYTLNYNDIDVDPIPIFSRFSLVYDDLLDIDILPVVTRKFLLPFVSTELTYSSLAYRFKYFNDNELSKVTYTSWRLFYKNIYIEERENRFTSKWKHKESLPAEEVFQFPYGSRKLSVLNPIYPIYEIERDRDTYRYTAFVESVFVLYGDYVILVDNGNRFSSYFGKVEFTPTGPQEIYSEHGLKIRVANVDNGTLDLLFTIENVDIKSSISISFYKDDGSGVYENISYDWPGWISYINVDSYNFNGQLESLKSIDRFYLELPSEGFKILPFQADTCCLTNFDKDLCDLSGFKDANYVDPPEPVVCELKLSLTAEDDKFSICALIVTLEATTLGDVPDNSVYEWEQTSGTGIEWLTGENTLFATYEQTSYDDKEFRIWMNRGTEFELYDDIKVYGTATTFYHISGGPTKAPLYNTEFKLTHEKAFVVNSEDNQSVINDGLEQGALLWTKPTAREQITGYVIQERDVRGEWIDISTILDPSIKYYQDISPSSTYRIKAYTEFERVTFISNQVYTSASDPILLYNSIQASVPYFIGGGRNLKDSSTITGYQVYTASIKSVYDDYYLGSTGTSQSNLMTGYQVYTATIKGVIDNYYIGSNAVTSKNIMTGFTVIGSVSIGG
ncbi:hypothetical protein N9242_00880 [Vicingaceae bacterium]|nr:hypothetical protein [Vicingaceae bacterium]